MSRLLAAVVVVSMAASAVRADDKPLDGDLKKLQGQWISRGGPDGTPLTLVFDKTRVQIKVIAPTGDEMTIAGDLSIDEKATPRAMTWSHVKVRSRDLPDLPAIYAFDGEDSLKIAGVNGTTRPTEFIEKGKELPGIRPNTMIFTRVKADAKK